MAVKDYTRTVGPAINKLLADGERLLAASPMVQDAGTSEDVSASDELANLLDPTILLGLGTHPGNAVQRAVFGRAVTGASDSLGRGLFEAVGRSSAPKVAVTDRRLLIVEIDVTPQSSSGW